MVPNFIDRAKLVHKPGVYLFFNAEKEVIYVGKAIDLNKRVQSYFRGYDESSSAYLNKKNHDLKTHLLVEHIASLDTIVVSSELEALILEANLIKKYLPQYNIRLTDDKDYLYIKITDQEFPQVLTARKTNLKDALDYFGPFPSSTIVKSTLKTLRRVFPWCSNPPPKQLGKKYQSGFLEGETLAKTRLKPCFYFHLKLCPGACVGVVEAKDYRKVINRFRRFMSGQRVELIEELRKEMEEASKELNFEQAQRIKQMIGGVDYLTQPTSISAYLENPNFIEDQRQKSLEDLQQDLSLPELPVRIECYDISNFQGEYATGSMVVLTDGEIDKSQYRKFKIKISGKPDDYAMHQEMMTRRLKHPEWPLPQLFLIDGGRGQARASYEVLQQHSVDRPIFGLAKRMEWLYPPEGEVIKLPHRSLGLRLLQRIRDEAHRFAITYHRNLRKKGFGLI